MSYPKQPGQDAEAHLRVTEQCLLLSRENRRLKAELEEEVELKYDWKAQYLETHVHAGQFMQERDAARAELEEAVGLLRSATYVDVGGDEDLGWITTLIVPGDVPAFLARYPQDSKDERCKTCGGTGLVWVDPTVDDRNGDALVATEEYPRKYEHHQPRVQCLDCQDSKEGGDE